MSTAGRNGPRHAALLSGVFALLLTLAAVPARGGAPAPSIPPKALPRLVDLGAGKCIPCRKMAPILEEMKKDYAAVVDVVFVDVWKDPQAGTPYRIRLIPTQVFFDREGKEVFRHEGFMAREEIEKVFQEKLGVTPIAKPRPGARSDGGAARAPGRDAIG